MFYVDLTRPAGSQYFEAACAGWQNNCDGATADPRAEWGCQGKSISGVYRALGTGELNTTNILAGCSTAGSAADLADDYSHNSLDDWFLPSKDELNALCKWAFGDTVNAVCNNGGSGGLSRTNGGFSTDAYWSSSESSYNAWVQYFYGGYQASYNEFTTGFVRPVRAF